jgi:hypothetical protein
MANPNAQFPAQNIVTDQGVYPFSALLDVIKRLIAALFGAGASTVVWRPGVPSAGNVFDTWAEVVAAVAKLNGAVTIGLDTDVAAAVIPPGNYDLRPAGVSGPVTIVNASKTPPFLVPFFQIGPGAVTIKGLSGLDDVSADNQSTVPVIVLATNAGSFTISKQGAVFQEPGAAAFLSYLAGANADLLLLDFASFTSLGGTNAIRVAAGAVLTIEMSGESLLDTNQLIAAAGTTGVTVGYFAIYRTQAGAPAVDPQIRQSGSTAIVVGTGKTAAIPAFITANSRIVVSLKTPVGDALTVKYAALAADRVAGAPGSFKISALAAAGGGAVNGVDTSTIDWEVTHDA